MTWPRRSGRKFGNVKVDGFDSKKEARRARELRMLEQAGKIAELRLQVRYEIIPQRGADRAAFYVADFVYLEDGVQVVEDSKGKRTADYILKRKLMGTVHGITIRET